jgi:ABC-type multidrug transport system ATPase subunit
VELASASPAAVEEPGIDLGAGAIRLGRANDNDLELDDLRVSRHHARIEPIGNGRYRVTDLGSSNGTFVNGRRARSEEIGSGDFLGLGGQTLQILGTRLRIVGSRHTAWLGAAGLVVSVEGHRILDDVGFALEPSSLLAVVGPSGSGKSTLLNALTGFRPADAGNVVFDGRDVYANYDDLRLRMGLVPQSDILHAELTVRQALGYAAELRLPVDVTPAMRADRVAKVVEELRLQDRFDTRIDRLSGGQRKRVSVGCELLTEPALLFLDEPTSGLDPGNEAALMATLRDIARAGRTVVVVTHSVQSLDLCDRMLVLAPGGRLAFFGPPAEALPYFAQFGAGDGYAAMFRALEDDAAADWTGRYRASPRYEELVQRPLESADLLPVPPRPNIDPPAPPTPTRHQVSVLVRRYLAVIRADRGFALTLAAQAPIFGLLFSAMYFFNAMKTSEALNGSILIWLVILGATWLGTSNAIREIVKELPIYRRERSIGLSPAAYILSKVAVLGTITALQAVILVPIAMRNQVLPPTVSDHQVDVIKQAGYGALLVGFHLPDVGAIIPSQFFELVLVAVIVGLAGMALGLLVSAVAGGVDRAASLLPVLLVAHVIVSAPLFTASDPILESVGNVLSAKWGMAAAASTLDLTNLRKPYVIATEAMSDSSGTDGTVVPPYERPTWKHDSGTWLINVGVLVGLSLLSVLGAWYMLRSTDPNLMDARRQQRGRASPFRRLLAVPALALRGLR